MATRVEEGRRLLSSVLPWCAALGTKRTTKRRISWREYPCVFHLLSRKDRMPSVRFSFSMEELGKPVGKVRRHLGCLAARAAANPREPRGWATTGATRGTPMLGCWSGFAPVSNSVLRDSCPRTIALRHNVFQPRASFLFYYSTRTQILLIIIAYKLVTYLHYYSTLAS